MIFLKIYLQQITWSSINMLNPIKPVPPRENQFTSHTCGSLWVSEDELRVLL